MLRSTHSDDLPHSTSASASRCRAARNPATDGRSAYDRSFWIAYVANTSLMMCVCLLFRYGDFIYLLGGSELQLGWIVGIGTIGALAMRLAQGASIDHYGPRNVWIFSLVSVIISLLAHLLITRVDGPAIYMVRMLFHTSIAGAFGSSITYISLRAPVVRMAEVVGTLGSSGFLGMILGTQLGDVLCGDEVIERVHVDRLFLAAACMATCSLVCAWLATRGELRPAVRRRPPMLWLIRRYHPGRLLLMGMMMGIGVGLPGTFLRPYTEALGITTIGTFFGAYAVTAFVVRMATRHLPARIGIAPMILLGMASLVISMILQLVVKETWHLAIPGIAAGIAHALLFPSVMAGGSTTFPARYRGLATTLTLATFDIGNLVGMPLAGSIVYFSKTMGLSPYPIMFLSIAAVVTGASVYFALGVRSQTESRRKTHIPEAVPGQETVEIIP